jgi:hypothetical protein
VGEIQNIAEQSGTKRKKEKMPGKKKLGQKMKSINIMREREREREREG